MTPPLLIERLERHAHQQGNRVALVFFSRARPSVSLTWSELALRVRALSARWRARGCRPGDGVAIVSSSPGEQALGLLSAMGAGAIPSIFSHPSIKQTTARYLSTFGAMLDASGTRWLLVSEELAEQARGWVAGRDAVAVLTLADLDATSGDASASVVSHGPTAFVQYSSGTTGIRKAVAVTHAMLAHQADSYGDAIQLSSDDFVVSWLPLYHDMGLLASLLIPLFRGAASLHMSPFEWLQSPALLFETLSHYRGTLAWLPNFGFALLAKRLDGQALAACDLRSLRALINCSEPARDAALSAFATAFAGIGIRPQHLQVCYALAENTFAATQTPFDQPARRIAVDREGKTITLLSCGKPIAGTEVRISASESNAVGEIELRGTSLMTGYLADSGSDTFSPDGWFRTGDLGCLVDGELIVTGRKKDLIICRGMNLYPQDVEEVIQRVAGVKAGRVVVFGVYDESAGTEGAIAMLEPEQPGLSKLRESVHAAVFEEFGITLRDCVICEPGTLQKSTSGKLSRARNREAYENLSRPGSAAK